MSDARQTLREEARFRILRLLEENPQMSQRELAPAAQDLAPLAEECGD